MECEAFYLGGKCVYVWLLGQLVVGNGFMGQWVLGSSTYYSGCVHKCTCKVSLECFRQEVLSIAQISQYSVWIDIIMVS